MNPWESILSGLERRVNHQNFDTWLRPTSFCGQEANIIWVQVPNQHFKQWISENFSSAIQETLGEMNMAEQEIRFLVSPNADTSTRSGNGHSPGHTHNAAPRPENSASVPSALLNSKYSFDNFVVGSSNQFAHAAALAVAEQPSRTYNPLFIYGGVGLGKTHLMHAIGQTILARNKDVRLSYMSSEHFTNEVINSIRYDRTVQFREKYRTFDVLLMDDIQFLRGKERTQEEFFHTFNALYDSQKQIVISSDCQPKEIPTLQERLHSRFEWGLIADIQPPDLETKVAILRKKAERENVELPDSVALFIASNVKSNVRELEGSLVRLIAYSSLTGMEITLGLAQDVLRNIVADASRPVSTEVIQKVVSEHFGLKVSELKAKNNARNVSEPRQIAMYLCKTLTNNSLPKIGREFGGKHHTTVLHSVRKIEAMRVQDKDFNAVLNKLIGLVQ